MPSTHRNPSPGRSDSLVKGEQGREETKGVEVVKRDKAGECTRNTRWDNRGMEGLSDLAKITASKWQNWDLNSGGLEPEPGS